MIKRQYSILLILVILSLSMPVKADASVLDDVVNGVKSIFSSKSDSDNQQLLITTNIQLAPEGDIDGNGEIDAGDVVRFTYTLTNNTDKEYPDIILKTNVNRNQLNFIHNIVGTSGIDDNGKTISIPNIQLAPSQVKTISFDARINYSTAEDPIITTEADLITKEKKSVAKSFKKEFKANRIKKELIPGAKKMEFKKETKKE